MGAIVIDLKDFGVRTPEQTVRLFYELYDHRSVQAQLWEAFRLYAVNDEKGIAALDMEETKLALLFDHLTDLVKAVETLRASPAGFRCAVCGRTDDRIEE